jgi:hypothetical protein
MYILQYKARYILIISYKRVISVKNRFSQESFYSVARFRRTWFLSSCLHRDQYRRDYHGRKR